MVGQKTFLSALFGLVAVVCSTCEQSREWELDASATPQLVIEAILTDRDTFQEIILSESYASLNGEPPPVTDAVVEVEANGLVYAFATDPLRPGRYRSRVPFAVVDDLTYQLSVFRDQTLYEATSELADVTPMPAVSFLPFGETDSLRLGNFIPPYDVNQQSMYEITIDWSHLAAEAPNSAKLYRYTFSEIHVSQFVPPPSEELIFPKGSKVRIIKYGLNDEFAAYLHARAIETDWNSNFFFSTPDNLPTNISSGGLGFFSVCTVIEEEYVAE